MSDSSTTLPPDNLSSSTEYCNETVHAVEPLAQPYAVTFFQTPPRIERVHRNTPRFGKTRDINRLLLGNFERDGSNYVVGVVGSSIAIAVTVAVWLVILLVLRCLGPNRVGLFSGKLPPQANEREKAEARTPAPATHFSPQNEQQEGEKGPLSKGHTGRKSRAPKEGAERHRDISRENDADSDDIPPDVVAALSPDTLVSDRSSAEWDDDKAPPRDDDDPPPSERRTTTTTTPSGRGCCCCAATTTTPARRLKCARAVVLLCGVGIAVCVILLCSLGVPSLIDALTSARTALQDGQALALEGAELIETLLVRMDATQGSIQSIADRSTPFCPLLVESYCMAYGDGCDADAIKADLDEFVSQAEVVLENNLHKSRNDLLKIAGELEDFYGIVGQFWWAFSVAFGFAIVQALLAIAVSYGVVLASKNGDQHRRKGCRHTMTRIARSCFLVPAFALVSFLSFVFTLVFVIGSIGAADFCVDSPDPRLLAVIEDNKDFFTSSVYGLIRFYVGGCPQSSLPPIIGEASAFALNVTTFVSDLTGALAGLTDAQYLEVCGAEKVELAVYSVEAATCLLAASTADVQNLFQCAKWRPLYTAVFYDAICYEGHKGLYYVCVTQFLVVFFAMTMLTFRASFAVAPAEPSENAHEEVAAAPEEPTDSFAPQPTESISIVPLAPPPKKHRENEGQDPSAFVAHRDKRDKDPSAFLPEQTLPTADPPAFFPHWDEAGFSLVSGTTTMQTT